MRGSGIAITYMVFDVLSLEGVDLMLAPYSERRTQLEAFDLNGVHQGTFRAHLLSKRTPDEEGRPRVHPSARSRGPHG
jgi:ATP-dependent DNA ligase